MNVRTILTKSLGAIRRGTDSRLHPKSDTWLGFSSQANEAFHSTGIGRLVPSLSEKNNTASVDEENSNRQAFLDKNPPKNFEFAQKT